jgi:hypothetical protein
MNKHIVNVSLLNCTFFLTVSFMKRTILYFLVFPALLFTMINIKNFTTFNSIFGNYACRIFSPDYTNHFFLRVAMKLVKNFE